MLTLNCDGEINTPAWADSLREVQDFHMVNAGLGVSLSINQPITVLKFESVFLMSLFCRIDA